MDREQMIPKIIAAAKQSGLVYKYYDNTKLLNVTDTDGVVQSYYCTTGTVIFRDGNNKYTQSRHTERDMDYKRFLDLCEGKEDIIETFFGG